MILTRRHLRKKVMQSLFAMELSKNIELEKERKFLVKSIDQLNGLFLANLSFLIALRDHADYLYTSSKNNFIPSTKKQQEPHLKIRNNKVLNLLNNHPKLSAAIEKYKVDYWDLDTKYVSMVYDQLKEHDFYLTYQETSQDNDFKTDLKFVINIFKEVVVEFDPLYQYFEDREITWGTDFPVANSMTLHYLEKLKDEKSDLESMIPTFIKDRIDVEFAIDLFQKTKLHEAKFTEAIDQNADKWELKRIAPIDKILISMGICELLYFPSIPTKVTLNEYIEISKDFSTPKSNIFINGLLDKFSKEYTRSGEINKIGRGLL